MSEYSKAYYQQHKEAFLKAQREWRAKNPNKPAVKRQSDYLNRREDALELYRATALEELGYLI